PHRFDFLVSRRRDAPERHRTLRGALDWSYQLLSPELQQFFAQLSLFRGGWSLEAAAAACGSVDVGEYGRDPARPDTHTPTHPHSHADSLDLLAELRDASLVLVDEGPEGIRFRMLETLREYAAEKLAPEESELVRRQHAAYFLTEAEAAAGELRGPE